MATTDPRWVLDDLGRLALRASSRAEFFDEAALRLKRVAAVRRRVLAHPRPGLGPHHPAPAAGHPRPLPGPRRQRVRGERRQQVRRSRRGPAQGGHAERGDRRPPRAQPPLPRPAHPGRHRSRAAQRLRRRRHHLGRADPRPPRRRARLRGSRRRAPVPRLQPVRAGRAARPRGRGDRARVDAAPTPEPPGVVELDAGNDPIRASRRRPSRCWPSCPAPRPRTACAPRRCTRWPAPRGRAPSDACRLRRSGRPPAAGSCSTAAAWRRRPADKSRSSSSARTRPSSRRCCSRPTA